MNLKNIIICKYKDCNKVYRNDVILPCGKRVCQIHIDEMKIDDSESLKCFFCSKLHLIPEDGFIIDDLIEKLLNVKYGDKHDAAKKAFDNLKKELDISLNKYN